MRRAHITITETKEIELHLGGLSPVEVATALDAAINVICEQTAGDPIKGAAMKKFCQDQNLQARPGLILPTNFKG